MSDQKQSSLRTNGSNGQPAGQPGDSPIFGAPVEQRDRGPMAAWVIGSLIVIAAVVALVYAGRNKPAPAPNTLLPADAYAASLPLSQLAMSESENLSGGKMTYLDGHVQNTGDRTATAITVQVVFQNDLAMPPQIDTVPLTLIRMKQPYIDTEPVAANPLKPGDDREFRLTFESMPENWNQVMPEVRIVHTELK